MLIEVLLGLNPATSVTVSGVGADSLIQDQYSSEF